MLQGNWVWEEMEGSYCTGLGDRETVYQELNLNPEDWIHLLAIRPEPLGAPFSSLVKYLKDL
jgi:hypothetical protein